MEALLKRAEKLLAKEDYEIIKSMAQTIAFLSSSVGKKNVQIGKLTNMLFGVVTEKTAKVLKEKKEKEKADSKDKPTKGHGKNGASQYSGAEVIEIAHPTLKPKDKCPSCKKGKVYEISIPKTVVRITAQAPLSACLYQMQRLRCNLCGTIFTADAPEGIGDKKYDSASGAMIGLLKYGAGLPFHRLENLQSALEVPLASSTQWEIVEEVSKKIAPVYEEMTKTAAQGDIIYNDDTVAKVLENILADDKDRTKRKATFTSGFASVKDGIRIALFYTGNQHAGENLSDLLAKRNKEVGPPIQMCDALSRNVPKDFQTILANCLAHARRRFIDNYESFPQECEHVLRVLKRVYINDAYAKENNMSPDERLEYHQKKSASLMKDLKKWLASQLDDKKIEPNSSMGQAITYMLKHWKGMTLFLHVAKAPLDNNLCEQVLKKAILHRKNALFYKSFYGAYVGDVFMSLIYTCQFCKANPFKYLKALQENTDSVVKEPGKWMPWNYLEMV